MSITDSDSRHILSPQWIVRLAGVSVTQDTREILRNVSLDIRKGSCVRILGGNGSGKTTLLRLIKGDLNQDGGISPSRMYYFNGEESASPISAHRHARFVSPGYQDRYRQKGWNLTGEEIIATGFDDSPLLYRDLLSEERDKVTYLASWLNIGHLLNKSILTMSRGEGRRVLIARALVSNPELLLLDEFLHELDPRGRKDVAEMAERAFEKGTTVVYTGHRAEERLSTTDDEYELVDGRIVPVSDLRVTAPVRRRRTDTVTPRTKDTVRELFHLRKCSVFYDEKPVLRELNMTIDSSQNWVVLGGNGAGKSTFMRLLYGFSRPALGGEIVRCGIHDGELLHAAQSRIGFLSSEFQARYDGECSAIETVLSGLRGSVGVYDDFTEAERETAMGHLGSVGLSHDAERAFSTFSYGEQRKIIFARACAISPDVLLLDEPFAGIDTASRDHLLSLIEEISVHEARFVISVHHAEDIPATATHILHIESGKAVYAGPAGEFPMSAYMTGV